MEIHDSCNEGVISAVFAKINTEVCTRHLEHHTCFNILTFFLNLKTEQLKIIWKMNYKNAFQNHFPSRLYKCALVMPEVRELYQSPPG